MATFSYSSFVQYKGTGNPKTYDPDGAPDDTDGVLNDGETSGTGSTTFESGDVIGGGDYVGTVDLGGGETGIVVDLGSNKFGVYSTLASADTISALPSFQVADLSTTAFTTCFLTGTLITTDAGETAVEALKTGDMVQSVDGKMHAVRWIGHQTVDTRFGPAERLMPIRIAAGALGDGAPHSDLTVTADHAMLVDGVLVHAGAMVNGTTITRVPLAELGQTYVVYHVELETQQVILANGAAAESFVDNAGRMAFDNHAEFTALYGDAQAVAELDLPRAMSPRQLPLSARKMLGLVAAA